MQKTVIFHEIFAFYGFCDISIYVSIYLNFPSDHCNFFLLKSFFVQIALKISIVLQLYTFLPEKKNKKLIFHEIFVFVIYQYILFHKC